MIHLPVEQVGYDPQFYPRVNGKEDWLTVHRYKEALTSQPWKADHFKPGGFPPVIVVKTGGYEWPYILLDGLHRLRAFTAAGQKKIWAEEERIPKSKWLSRSVELNIVSKRALDSGDKRWVAKRLRKDGWKPEKIAALLEMEVASFEKLVGTGVHKLTRAAAARIPEGRSNRTVGGDHFGFLKHPFAEAAGTANATATLEAQAPVSSRESQQIVGSFIALLESGCVDLTDEEMAADLAKAHRLLGELLA